MIASLNGVVRFMLAEGVVVEVGGVGYLVHISAPLKDRLRPGEAVFLYIYHVIREDTNALYGFETLEGREFFQYLIGVDGIGPKLALNILSALQPDTIRRAIFNEQPELFMRVPGIGKKTAQKILFYLQGKVTQVEGMAFAPEFSDLDAEILEALTALGYSVVEAQAAVQAIPKDAPHNVEDRLRLALQYFTS